MQLAHAHTQDRARPETVREKRSWERVRRAEREYYRRLNSVASQVDMIVKSMMGDFVEDPHKVSQVQTALRFYATALRPWAESVAKSMIVDVSRRDEAVWAALAKEMSRDLRNEIKNAPTGQYLRRMLTENVDLITSLPTEAANRVHKMTVQALHTSERAASISQKIMRTGDVTRARAMLIARTEVARTASGLVEARSLHVGSEGYIWRTVGDGDVRKEHKKLNGRFFKWSDPPVSGSSGEKAHAGQIYNCRCYPEPVIPEIK